MEKRHEYKLFVTWERASRNYLVSIPGKPPIPGSADPVFGGDAARWNPEELFLASLSACHQLWYLGLCAGAGVSVLGYEDSAEGLMLEETPGGAGQFTEVVLRPQVRLAPGADAAKALALHHTAHEMCFIARSVNFPVSVEPVIC
jgi:organic hydroperoxide reductase OsmC/OhrA